MAHAEAERRAQGVGDYNFHVTHFQSFCAAILWPSGAGPSPRGLGVIPTKAKIQPTPLYTALHKVVI